MPHQSFRNSAFVEFGSAEGKEAERAELERERDEWEAAACTLEDAETQIDALEARVSSLEAERNKAWDQRDKAHTDALHYGDQARAAEARIRALEEQVARLREALKPIDAYAARFNSEISDDVKLLTAWVGKRNWVHVTYGDFRRARTRQAWMRERWQRLNGCRRGFEMLG